jgi:predicted permease
MRAFPHDLRLATRNWRRRPLLTAVVVFTLALGISATAVVFSVVDAVLLAPLPYAEPERLFVIRAALPGQKQAIAQMSGPDVQDVLDRTTTIAAGGAVWARPGVLAGTSGEATEIEVGWITPGFLEALGTAPLLGRLPTADEHHRIDVMVLDYDLWQQHFGGDPAIVGRRIDFDAEPRTVVGVMPRGFRMYFPPDDGVPATIRAWLPWGRDLRELTRAFRVFTFVARLDLDAARPALDTELATIAAAAALEHVDYARSGFALNSAPLADALVAPVRPTLLVLMAVVVIVLLIAAANVANLLLIRETERTTEFALRLALGARRTRLWRQIVTESLALGLIGGAAGLGLAAAGIALLAQLDPTGLPRVGTVAVGVRTWLAAGAASVLAALAFGSIAGRHALTSARHATLQGTTRGSTRTSATSRTLVVAQLALAAVLACGAALLAQSVMRLYAIDPGFNAAGVLSLRLSLPDVRYPYDTGGTAIAEFYRQLDDRLSQLPGVDAAGATLSPPLAEATMRSRPYAYRMRDGDVEWGALAADYRTVTPGWFRAVGARLVSGRFVDARDRWDRPIAVVVDTTLAQKAWPGRDAVGQEVRVELFREGRFLPHWGEVVGVIEPIRLTSLVQPGREQVYIAHHQSPQRTMFPAVATRAGDPLALLPAIRAAVQAIEPGLPAFDIRLATSFVADATAHTRFALIGTGLFASAAVLLAMCGVFAALAAAVGQRRREFGIRLALGASPAAVFRATLSDGLKLAALGIAAGLAAAAGSTRAIESLLYGIGTTDAPTFAAVAIGLTAVAAIACGVPAARAARVDAGDALKSE